jgi:hypothetical protein
MINQQTKTAFDNSGCKPKGRLEIPIVLTATVIPNGIASASTNPEARLREYIAALEFYLPAAPVIFLENSRYPLEQHPEFRETSRLRVRRFQPSANPERGKGYQEFEMIDAWLASEPQPPERWLKITGRYQIQNLHALLNECRQDADSGLIIDQVPRAGMARTYFFCANTGFYRERLAGLYRRCDDRTGAWIERVLFGELKDCPAKEVHFFVTQPRIKARAGSSGAAFPTGRFQWRVKQILRRLNRFVDRRYLWHPK